MTPDDPKEPVPFSFDDDSGSDDEFGFIRRPDEEAADAPQPPSPVTPVRGAQTTDAHTPPRGSSAGIGYGTPVRDAGFGTPLRGGAAAAAGTPAQLQSAKRHADSVVPPVQYGLQDVRGPTSEVFKDKDIPYYRIDTLNNIIVYGCILQNRNLEEACSKSPEIKGIVDCLGDTLRSAFTKLYTNVKTEVDRQVAPSDNLSAYEDSIIKICCQEGLSIAREQNIPIQFDLTGLDIAKVASGHKSFTSSELREVARMYHDDHDSINHISFYKNGEKQDSEQIKSLMENFKDLSTDRTPARPR